MKDRSSEVMSRVHSHVESPYSKEHGTHHKKRLKAQFCKTVLLEASSRKLGLSVWLILCRLVNVMIRGKSLKIRKKGMCDRAMLWKLEVENGVASNLEIFLKLGCAMMTRLTLTG